MTPQEQAAFVRAYSRHVGKVPHQIVSTIVRQHYANELVEHPNEYNSILDALGLWHEAIKWEITNQMETTA